MVTILPAVRRERTEPTSELAWKKKIGANFSVMDHLNLSL
jgi:hypothetical protein